MIEINNKEAMCQVAKDIIAANGIEIATYLETRLRHTFTTVPVVDIRPNGQRKMSNLASAILDPIADIVYESIMEDKHVNPSYLFGVTIINNILHDFNIVIMQSEDPVYLKDCTNSRICTVKVIQSSKLPNTAIIIFRGGQLHDNANFSMILNAILQLIFDRILCIDSVTDEEFAVVTDFIYILSLSRVIIGDTNFVSINNDSKGMVSLRLNMYNRRLDMSVGRSYNDVKAILDIFKSVTDEIADIPVADVIDIMNDVKDMFKNVVILNTVVIDTPSRYRIGDSVYLPYMRIGKINKDIYDDCDDDSDDEYDE